MKIIKCKCGNEKFIRKSIAEVKLILDKFENIKDEVIWEDYVDYKCEKCGRKFN